jgi:N-acetylglucosamine-6-phosphate deacetylase
MKDISEFKGDLQGISYYDQSPVSISIEKGIITKTERIKGLKGNVQPLYIAPGLIDMQINGYMSVSFALEGADDTAASSADLSAAEVQKVTKGLWKEGVTTYFPTLTTNSRELLLKNFKIISGAIDDPSLLGSVPGFHLEGPYISPVDGYRGAHPREFVRKPDWNEFMEFYKATGGRMLIVTIAPEVEGATEFIRKCREKGILVSLGHHNGSADQIKTAADNGAGMTTHLGNGCATNINRHHNPLWPQLADDRLIASIICDGFHLPPDLIKVIYNAKGADRIVITSDITSYAGLPAGEYKIKSGETIVKTPEGNLRFSGQGGGLYGSATPLWVGVGHVMKVTGCSLAKAISMTSSNVAKVCNLTDRGTLEPGKRADIVMFTLENFRMSIKRTMVAGKFVYEAE